VVFAGGLLLIVGHFFGMLAVADLYRVDMGPERQSVSSAEAGFRPSPLSQFAATPFQLWCVYVAATALVVLAMIMVGSQPMTGDVAIIYLFCPLALAAATVGWTLRQAKRIAVPAATVYVGLGVCLIGVGAFWLVELWGARQGDGNALIAAFGVQAGLALVAGGLVKIWRTPEEADEPILADIVETDGAAAC
jgi:hypothetical protein